jgi:FKBP-type peptidyl-prolyl cis-trans isomerase
MPARFRSILIVLLATAASSCAWFRPRPPEYPLVRLPSGVVVHDLVVPEKGEPARSGDTVTLEYQLGLEDGTMVDSSLEHGQRLRFRIGDGQVPVGLEQGVEGMRLFGRRELIVPPDLGYGEEGMPPVIPGNARLYFEVELMELLIMTPEASP